MVSTTVELPGATTFKAMNWACISVGKPGYSVVRKDWALSELAPALLTCNPVSVDSTLTPASRNLSMTASRWPALALCKCTSPPATATAHKNVPVSIRSATTAWLQPFKLATPSIRIRLVPCPSMRAPILMSISAKSVISGSCAALSSTVTPSASAAAIIKFSVPVTVTISVVMCAPVKRVCPTGKDASI